MTYVSFCFFTLDFLNRMILKYLIPVKLSLGILPKNQLLEKYNLVEVWLVLQLIILNSFMAG